MPQDQLFDLVGAMVDAGKGDEEIAAAIKDYKSKQPQPPKAPEPVKRGALTRIADTLPMVGGAIGDVYGPAFSAIGGAAGEGYKQLLKHGGEIPGAIADVARNVVNEPAATFKGLHQGIAEGAINATKEAGKQALISGTGRAIVRGLSPVVQGAKTMLGGGGTLGNMAKEVFKNRDVIAGTAAAANLDNPKALERIALLRLLSSPTAWARGGAALAKAPVANLIRGGSILSGLTQDEEEP